MSTKAKATATHKNDKKERWTTSADINNSAFDLDALRRRAADEIVRRGCPDTALLEKVNAVGGWDIIHDVVVKGGGLQVVAELLAAGGIVVSQRMAVRVYFLWKERKGYSTDRKPGRRPKAAVSMAPEIDSAVSDELSAALGGE